jgi:phosphopantetheine--protein transferase-like protein
MIKTATKTTKTGIGIDIEETSRFKDLDEKSTFLKNNYTKEEIKYCFSKNQPQIHLAGMFCAKEATKKATGKDIPLNTIEITHSKTGKPEIKIREERNVKRNKKGSEKSKKAEQIQLTVSISHTKTTAVAVVILI